MQHTIGGLGLQTLIAVSFRYVIVHTYTLTQKLLVVCGCSTYQDCSTIGHAYFLSYSCMRDTIAELWLQTPITVSFGYATCVYLHA